eukprot:CAMPEP_0181101704 /NCGR_PEP_ID=MMETSP1071-20121207/13906_1 /TAXON_ID=35127 /ORGANISM="Thalassiosira sp., Strain NH16" /LENGTH=275 /DNA_ID=CAMNT_0023184593 /DNA_START=147 /DNA_END=974 /DNA_ORIENTATION=+
MISTTTTEHKVLVVGSTGATGKHVVQMLLDRGDTEVTAITRSKDRLMGLLKNSEENFINNLTVVEGGIQEMSIDYLKTLCTTAGCTAVVSCLGHNITFHGMFREGLFVSESVQKLTTAMPKGCRFVMMGTDGVAHPDGSDPKRTRFERGVLRIMRWLLPPVKDNERSTGILFEDAKNDVSYDWVAVRPGDLTEIPEEAQPDATKNYEIHKHTFGSLFGDNAVARFQVAHFIANLATMDSESFQKFYNHKMPVIYQKKQVVDTDDDNEDSLLSTHE